MSTEQPPPVPGAPEPSAPAAEAEAPPAVTLEHLAALLLRAEADRQRQAEALAALNSGLMLMRQQALQQGGQVKLQIDGIQRELQRFQTGTARHAMAAVFHKLFRDLLGHMNQLDQLLADVGPGQGDAAWIGAFQTARAGFETVLAEWGCAPMEVRPGQDTFDPEVHEAAPAGDLPIPPGSPPGTILQVQRRGWTLHGTIIQFPLVVAS